MLGDFGVVMVMDWGLALPTSQYEKQDSIFATSGLGGTPAFMAPEMATGPIDRSAPPATSTCSGATLYMIITGTPPHHAKNITECLNAVRTNDDPRSSPNSNMANCWTSRQSDGDQPGRSLSRRRRVFKQRSAIIARMPKASRWQRAPPTTWSVADGIDRIPTFRRRRFVSRKRSSCGTETKKRIVVLPKQKSCTAQAALENGDFDLGLSLLDEQVPEHQPIIKELREGIRERESHAARLSMLRQSRGRHAGVHPHRRKRGNVLHLRERLGRE